MSNANNAPLISIGIPTYNRADSYLRETLESALCQTYRNVEIVVSDNGSTDDTRALVTSYDDPRLKYHKQTPALAPNENFNYCLNAARGDYFLLLPDDDLIDPNFIEVCVEAAGTRPGVGLVRTGIRIIDGRGNVRKEKLNLVGGLTTTDFYLAWFSGKTGLYPPNTLFHRRALQKSGGFQSRHNLFLDVMAELLLDADRGRVDIEDIKASFRAHDNEFTFSVPVGEWCEDAADLLELMVNLAPDRQDVIRDLGTEFFAKLNYNRAAKIRSPAARWRAYFDVYRRFDRRISPVAYFWVNPLRRSARRKLRQFKRRLVLSPSSAGES